MNDSYQAIYDATRSRIGNADVGSAVAEAARSAFDLGGILCQAQNSIQHVELELIRPSVIFRPKLYIDGNQWCALLGENLQ